MVRRGFSIEEILVNGYLFIMQINGSPDNTLVRKVANEYDFHVDNICCFRIHAPNIWGVFYRPYYVTQHNPEGRFILEDLREVLTEQFN